VIKYFLIRIVRRIGRLQKHNYLSVRIEDYIENAFFNLNIIKNKRNLYNLRKLSSLHEYYEFAVDIFDPHQNKDEILSLLCLIDKYKPKIVCEIGTATGGTNFLISQYPKTVTTMIGIDLFVRNKFMLSRYNRNERELHYIDGSSYDSTSINKVKRILKDRYIDILFIDGDHSYEGAMKDYLNYSPLVKEGGLIVFHDIIPDYHTRFGKQTGKYAGDVPILWNELKEKHKHHEFVDDKQQDGLGIGVLHHTNNLGIS